MRIVNQGVKWNKFIEIQCHLDPGLKTSYCPCLGKFTPLTMAYVLFPEAGWVIAPEPSDIECRSLRLFSSCLTIPKARPQDEDVFDKSHTLVIHSKHYHYLPFPSWQDAFEKQSCLWILLKNGKDIVKEW